MQPSSAAQPIRIETTITDREEASEFLHAMYGARIQTHGPGGNGHHLAVSMTDLGGFINARTSIPGQVDYTMSGGDSVLIDTILAGTFETNRGVTGEHYQTGDVFIANAGPTEYRCRTTDIRTHAVSLPLPLVAEVADTTGDQAGQHVEFLSHAPIPYAAARWQRATRLIDDLLDDPMSTAQPLIVGPAIRLLATVALTVFPNTAIPEQITAARHRAHPETLRRAIAFIEANPDQDITINDIARAAYVTPRTIQLAFRRHLDTTPMAYLRRVRLDCAHQDLQNGGPGTSVTTVAYRWGFSNPTRFARYYQEIYGTSPQHTLRPH